ncbi:MAG: hypothetical protein GC189_11625 [Alphaproteobacteria bacterium]|nr:hypothetical protein [Alphaproteobacteria bacterium]
MAPTASDSGAPAGAMDDLVPDFIIETRRRLEAADQALARAAEGDSDARVTLLGLLHTIRGAAGCTGLLRVEAASHAAETIAAVGIDGPSRKLLQAALSGLKSHLDALSRGPARPEDDAPRAIGEAWTFAPIFIADAAETLGKRIAFTAEGGEALVPPRDIAGVRGALVHLIRNACDHGIETPEERRAAGKDETGQIGILAHRVRDGLAIDVADDGRGVTPALLDGLFTPGVSSATAAQRYSGAGIGLSAARAGIAEIGGALDLRRDAPVGACFRIVLPSRAAGARAA